MLIEGYDFEAYSLNTIFNNVPGVYVIFTEKFWLDVGETDELGNRVNGNNHERKTCWISKSNGYPISVAFRKIFSKQERQELEFNLRAKLKPVCGEK